ncbi:hypothetical protein [Siphonobacter sp. BAB-5405]|uniref:hypothetical protein n=1 Tax=Siphonobacter sp. BAB-5405 TaxID=1864825 RepID=UPI0011AEE560|nr:hypothetical protein [Siphonobacter sp. BAB-5405]
MTTKEREPVFVNSLSYNDIYSSDSKKSFFEYIKNISAEELLFSVCSYTVQIHNQKLSNSLAQIYLYNLIEKGLPKQIQKKVQTYINYILSKRNHQFNFINNTSSLIFIQHVLMNAEKLPIKTKRSAEKDHNIFKAYLWCTQKWIDEQEKNKYIYSSNSIEDIIKFLLEYRLPVQELQEFKDFRPQFIKSSYFFKFCKSDKQFSDYLNIFLKSYNIEDSDSYLYHLLLFYMTNYETFNVDCYTTVSKNHQVALNFLETLAINNQPIKYDKDFKEIRNYPIYKASGSRYIYLSKNFLIDKIYQGIIFKMGIELVKEKAIYNNSRIKSSIDFMSIFGQEFTENNLFYRCMEINFKNMDSMQPGSELKKIITAGEPDYYMRKKNDVFIFEFKNCLLNSEAKFSYDFNRIKEEIYIKFVKDRKGKDEGIMQIINTINAISQGTFKAIDDINNKSTIIYPIIVYTDSSFGLEGINHILNKEFKKHLKKYKFIVCNLTMINIDTLIKFQNLFEKDKIKLNKFIDEYHYLINTSSNIQDRLISFDRFLEDKLINNNIEIEIEIPTMMKEFMELIERFQEKK